MQGITLTLPEKIKIKKIKQGSVTYTMVDGEDFSTDDIDGSADTLEMKQVKKIKVNPDYSIEDIHGRIEQEVGGDGRNVPAVLIPYTVNIKPGTTSCSIDKIISHNISKVKNYHVGSSCLFDLPDSKQSFHNNDLNEMYDISGNEGIIPRLIFAAEVLAELDGTYV